MPESFANGNSTGQRLNEHTYSTTASKRIKFKTSHCYCSNFYILEKEVTALNLKTALLLTILTVSVDIDVLDVFFIFILNMAHLCLYSLTTRFFIIYNNNREHSHYKMAASTARMVISR